MADTLGVGFSYEEIFEMCQRVTQMDSLQTRPPLSPLSSDRVVMVEVEGGPEQSVGRRRRAISFRKHVSEQSAQSCSHGSEERPAFMRPVKIIGGNLTLQFSCKSVYHKSTRKKGLEV